MGSAATLLFPWASFILVHPVPISLCHLCPFLTMRTMSLFVCDFFPHFLSPVFLLLPLSVTVMLSQTYDDIDLENEPWYKFFSELEFGRPVSQGLATPLNTTLSQAYTHYLHSTRDFFMSVLLDWVGLVVWACDTCLVLVWCPLPYPQNTFVTNCGISLCCWGFWFFDQQALKCSHVNLDTFISVGSFLHLVQK